MRFALRRLGFYLLAAWVALTLNFFLPRLMPGDPATALFARFKGRLSPHALEGLRQTFGLTGAPLVSQYFTYLRHVLAGDLGISIAYFPERVSSVIGGGLPWTLLLAGGAVVIAFALGTALGIAAAWFRGGLLDSVSPPLFALVGAFPFFWLSMVLLYALGFRFSLFPVGHAYGDDLRPGWSWAFAADVVRHAALPMAATVVSTVGTWLLGMRNTMLTALQGEPVLLARAKGLPPRQIALRYAARAALLPNLTGFGMALGFVLSGSLLTEIVFSYPGMGYLLVAAVRRQDYPLMQGIFLVITLAVLGANWLVDMALLWLDPRTRTE